MIDFGALAGGRATAVGHNDSRWSLGFFQHPELGVHVASAPNPIRPPFLVDWSGTMAHSGEVIFRYVGEGAIQAGDRWFSLAPAYDAPADFRFVSDGNTSVRVRYRWANVTGALDIPYAHAQLLQDDGKPVPAASPNVVMRGLGSLADALLAAAALLALAALVRAAPRFAAAAAAATLLAAFLPGGKFAPAAVMAFVGAGLIAVRGRAGMRRMLVGAYLSGIGVMAVQALHGNPPAPLAMIRNAGDDWFTYEAATQTLLSGSLRGGEDVFVYSPGFRYLHGLQRLLFGDGDLVSAFIASACVAVVVLAAVVVLSERRSVGLFEDATSTPGHLARILLLAAGGLAAGMTAMPALIVAAARPLSEWPTWAGWALVIAAVPRIRSDRAALAVGGLLGVMFTVRANQALGLLLVLGLVIFARGKATEWKLRSCTLPAIAFAAIALLPAVHNLAYGRQLVVLPQTPPLPVNFPLPPADLPDVLTTPATREVFFSQIKGVLYLDPADGTGLLGFGGAVHAAQQLWVVTVALAVRRRLRDPLTWGLLCLPLALLLPHLFVQVYVYYPRHIVAGYLTAVLACIAALAQLREARRSQGVDRPAAQSGSIRARKRSRAGSLVSR